MLSTRGWYPARRAAALAGVPVRTLYRWAETGLWEPEQPEPYEKMWSHSDLFALRLIDWLRKEKVVDEPTTDEEQLVSGTSMPRIRALLTLIRREGVSPENRKLVVKVDRQGRVQVRLGGQTLEPILNFPSPHKFAWDVDLVGPFEGSHGQRGPDLFIPRPHLRIIPGKLSGEPHVKDTRIQTLAIAALNERGFTRDGIRDLYPSLSLVHVDEALDLEDQLKRNSEAVAA